MPFGAGLLQWKVYLHYVVSVSEFGSLRVFARIRMRDPLCWVRHNVLLRASLSERNLRLDHVPCTPDRVTYL